MPLFRERVVWLNPLRLEPGEATDLIVAALISPFRTPPKVFEPSRSWNSTYWLLWILCNRGWRCHMEDYSTSGESRHSASFEVGARPGVQYTAPSSALALCRAFVGTMAVLVEEGL